MLNVSGLIKSKKDNGMTDTLFQVSPKSTVLDALKMMKAKNIGAVVVLDNDKLVGIFSERDYARKGILEGKHSKDTLIEDMMDKRLYVVKNDDSIVTCMKIMTDMQSRHIPVVDGDKTIGLISVSDVVRCIITQKDFMIDQLNQYIYGG